MALINCRFFNGYKPCGKNSRDSKNSNSSRNSKNEKSNCDDSCIEKNVIKKIILIVHLGALGSVVRSSALLRKIKKQEPDSYLIWLTSESVLPILQGHPAIDSLLSLSFINILKLQNYVFDDIYVIDKSLEAIGAVAQLNAKRTHGFKANPLNGAILPIGGEAQELWEIGISNHKKFYENKKTELQLIFESLGFEYQQEPYWLHLTVEELEIAKNRKSSWKLKNNKKIIVGINTGCSPMIPYKKLSVEKHVELIRAIEENFKSREVQLVLLGGAEDTERNERIRVMSQSENVIVSGSKEGLRDGILSVQACDVVISGDSLGMHLAIALNKYTIAWFGPTCDHEIDLFQKGSKIKTYLSCSPCWKRSCGQEKMCFEHVNILEFIQALEKGISFIGTTPPRTIQCQIQLEDSIKVFTQRDFDFG